MKRFILFFLTWGILIIARSQNIGIGTNSPVGKLHITGTENISQLIIDAYTLQGSATPLIKMTLDGTDVLHIHSREPRNAFFGVRAGSSTGGGHSLTAIGYEALQDNFAGFNTAVGAGSLKYNRGLMNNTAVGYQAMHYSNSTFNNLNGYNTALGASALRGPSSPAGNTGYLNTALGALAMINNTTGSSNTVGGYNSAPQNNTGSGNTGFGYQALFGNTSGNYNVGIGTNTLYTTNASEYNTAVGALSGRQWNNGYNNVFVGANAEVNAHGRYNVIALGQGTVVGASSTARFGNSATISYGGWAGWTNVSDGRFKTNVIENVPGLSFIEKLRPVTYNLQAIALDAFYQRNNNKELSPDANKVHNRALADKEKITYTGFIAQEVESAAKALGFEFSGVDAAQDNNDTYGLRYAEFVVPLVKAVQELSEENKLLKKRIETLEEMMKGSLKPKN